jgi:hypothetical protein
MLIPSFFLSLIPIMANPKPKSKPDLVPFSAEKIS